MTNTNPYCAALGIPVPRLETACSSPDANYYGLFLVALLERGAPLTLEEAAVRFEEAGVAPAHEALASLKRCKPARPPIYRDGDHYSLDPHDDEADLWAFRLGLRPARAVPLHVVRPDSGPPRTSDQPLTVPELDEAWREGIPNSWSAQRIAAAVLDAHDAAMSPGGVLAFVRARSQANLLTADSAQYWHHGSAVGLRNDGRWELDRAHAAVRSARDAVRQRIAVLRRWAEMRPDPAVIKANQQRLERERHAHGEALARLRRVLVHACPIARLEALVLVDVAERTITTLIGHEIAQVTHRLAPYEIIGAIGVRPLLRTLNIDPGDRRLAELSPPQKTRQLNRRGRTLTITTTLLVQGSCGISRPFGDDRTVRGYLQRGEHTKLRRRLEADAKSLFALYQYGRLHGAVRLRWGFLDEMLPAPWIHRDEPTLHQLLKEAYTRGVSLDVVVGGVPGWTDPWSRVRQVFPATDAWGWPSRLVDEQGYEIPRADVQLVRFSEEAIRTKATRAVARCPKMAARQLGLLRLLVGDVIGAAAVLSKCPGLGWSNPDHPGHTMFPLLAILLSSGTIGEALVTELEATARDPVELLRAHGGGAQAEAGDAIDSRADPGCAAQHRADRAGPRRRHRRDAHRGGEAN